MFLRLHPNRACGHRALGIRLCSVTRDKNPFFRLCGVFEHTFPTIPFLSRFRPLVTLALFFCAASWKTVAAVIPLPTAQTALLGRFAHGPINFPQSVGPTEFGAMFASTNPAVWPAEVQARQFFTNNGTALYVIRVPDSGSLSNALTGNSNTLTGLHAVEMLSNVRVLIAPELSLLNTNEFIETLSVFRKFVGSRGIFLILDPPPGLNTTAAMFGWSAAALPTDEMNCAIYYPYLQFQLDGATMTVPASGAMAAIFTQSDASYGIWHSPSGTSFPLKATTTSPVLNSTDSDSLTAQNINPIRIFTTVVPWGARSLNVENSETRYVSFVRTREWITASLERSLAFAATNDNAEPIWSRMRATAEDFLQSLFVQGAFVGSTPSQAYFVRCDSSTITASDISAHRVNLLYGVAFLHASEFLLTTITLPAYDSQRQPYRPPLKTFYPMGSLQFAYPTEAGFNYALESATNLTSAPWNTPADLVIGDGAWRWQTNTIATQGAAFFRLRIAPSR